MPVARGVLAAAVQPPSTKGRRDVAKQPYGVALRNVSSAGCLPPLFASLAIAIKKLIKKTRQPLSLNDTNKSKKDGVDRSDDDDDNGTNDNDDKR